jgi:hypothetical protein
MQGKWDEAQKQYETILHDDPTAKGRYLYGRLLLSRPGGDAAAIA